MFKHIMTMSPYTTHITIIKDGQEIASFRSVNMLGQVNTDLIKSIKTSHDDIRQEETIIVEV